MLGQRVQVLYLLHFFPQPSDTLQDLLCIHWMESYPESNIRTEPKQTVKVRIVAKKPGRT
jgi:hypothetical protein